MNSRDGRPWTAGPFISCPTGNTPCTTVIVLVRSARRGDDAQALNGSIDVDTARAERMFRWSVRSCALGPIMAGVALVLAILDIGGGDVTILSAFTLFLCFVAVFFGLAGLFGLALAHETEGIPPSPPWCIPCGIVTILGSFAVGLFGLLT